jgi:hypothetical protein
MIGERAIKNPKTYIKNMHFNKDAVMYFDDIELGSMITVEHRSNNPKRDFLFVNKNQCKHIPSSPTTFHHMCKALASSVEYALHKGEKVLVIGFAETATAIGDIVGNELLQAKYIMHTTRENILNSKQLITFEEEHSHATTQKLLTFEDGLDLSQFTYVLFVEDEISTGNTILNFIKAFKTKYEVANKFKYGVASICNWQSTEDIIKFNEEGIQTFALIRGNLIDTKIKMLGDNTNLRIIESDDEDNTDICENTEFKSLLSNKKNEIFRRERLGYFKIDKNSFKVCSESIEKLLKEKVYDLNYNTIRIIGTEEFMSVPILIGEKLERVGKTVLCHATTRSSIDVLSTTFDGTASGIKDKHKLTSVYEAYRNTYIYNIGEHVDLTLFVSDTPDEERFKQTLNELAVILGDKTGKLIGILL